MTRNVPYVTRLFCVKHPVQGRKSATTREDMEQTLHRQAQGLD